MTSSVLSPRPLRALAGVCLAALVALPSVAHAEAEEKVSTPEVNMVVLRENATGSASAAQRYIDDLVDAIAKAAGWSSAKGKYFTRRSSAQTFIRDTKPSFGILSLSAYLAMKDSHDLVALGKADIQNGGGHQFFVISKNQLSLDGCKSKSLGTNHEDAKFIDNIVSKDAFDLSDFEVEDTRRPVKTLKSVIAGDVECALIDDAQLMELQHLEGGLEVHPVWSSETLPPMVVTAFPTAADDERKAFSGLLDTVCGAEGKAACESTSMKLEATTPTAFAAYEKAYAG